MSVSPISREAYQLLHEGILAFARAEQVGIRVDMDYCEAKTKELNSTIAEKEETFLDSKFGRFWQHHYRGKININSNLQLGNLLYDVKKIKPLKYTAAEDGMRGSTDEETLSHLPVPGLSDLIEIRKLKKVRDTYLKGFMKEQVDGVLHPFFNLHTVRTYRSSSDRVNFQNIPKRDKEAMKICREALFPRKGNQLLEVDYSGVEVRISCVYNKDPKLIYDVLHGDQHGDMAVEIFLLDKMDKKVPELKYLRQASKNGFVFPQFYGDYFLNCAHNLAGRWGKLPQGKWKITDGVPLPDGKTLGQHLIEKGITNLDLTVRRPNGKEEYRKDSFMQHIKKIESNFWDIRYKTYTQWKKDWLEAYYRKGFFDTLTGFRCQGVMWRNDVINYPVQGTAFHCLLKSFILLDKEFSDRKLDSKLIAQIHDAIIIDMNPEEKDIVFPLVRKVMCDDLVKHWPWINVPLDIEADMAEVDESWAKVKPIKI